MDHELARGVVVNVVRRISEVTLRRARSVLGWVTVYRQVCRLDMYGMNCNQPTMSWCR